MLEGSASEGYVSGNGQIQTLPVADRGPVVELEGEDLDGESIRLEELRGKPVVINVWWSACPPCRREQPDLVQAAEQTSGSVGWVGINIRDLGIDNARRYVETFQVPYPSIYDPGGDALLQLRGALPPAAVPSTLVLDSEGRVAVRILGPIPSTRTLVALANELAAEPAG